MTTVIDNITEYQTKVLEYFTQVQDEVLTYVKQAVDAIEENVGTITIPEIEGLDQVPTLTESVSAYFSFNKKLLSNQEKFAKSYLKAIHPLTREGIQEAAAKAAADEKAAASTTAAKSPKSTVTKAA